MDRFNENTRYVETDMFAEIEIGGSDNAYAANPIFKPKSAEPLRDEKDKKRLVYTAMREMARESRRIDQSKLLYNQVQRMELSRLFYRQAVFMKDFEDDYTETSPFSSYFPSYLMMNYEQFRTYFTWRTQVRKGDITNISVSYAFTYIYELLNNIGVDSPQDGLTRLLSFWRGFREYFGFIDKYLVKWLKEYHVYYSMESSFRDFIVDNQLSGYYPDLYRSDPEDGDFELYCAISKYDIKHSSFYNPQTSRMINQCFCFVLEKIAEALNAAGIDLDHLVFQSANSKLGWLPFSDALFYPRQNHPDEQVVFSEKEIYVCRQNRWTCQSVKEGNRHLTGYIMKQMEASLRKRTNFKYKLSVNSNMLDDATAKTLEKAGVSLENTIDNAVTEFYAFINKKVVSVDKATLDKIRQEALEIQEKLLIEDVPEFFEEAVPEVSLPNDEDEQISDIWETLKKSLTKTETDALSVILQDGDIKRFSDANGIMLEVLIDTINQKAFDTIDDNVLDFGDYVMVYQEYRDKLIEMVMG